MLEVRRFYMPPTSIIGPGALKDSGPEIKSYGLKKALIVTDKILVELGVAAKVTEMLESNGMDYVIYSDIEPNPTESSVNKGYELLQDTKCDFIVSLGGGSPQDAAKGISILATNGGSIIDYEGVNISSKKGLPIVAINTTAGTASEVTINYVITNEKTHIKMVMVDKNSLATMAISDPELMTKKPAALTAATGMDALTHAIESYVTNGAFRLSDTLALESIKLIAESLETAVKDGNNIEARSKMAHASFIAGMSFSNAGLGYVHSMAHQLGGMYNLPHGVCNAILLPHVEEFNSDACGDKLRNVAEALGVETTGMSKIEANNAAIKAIKDLSKSVGIPSGLAELGVKEKDFKKLSEDALKDICAGGNPKAVTLEETMNIYKKAM